MSNNYKSKFEKQVAQNLINRAVEFKYEPYALNYYRKTRGGSCTVCGSTKIRELHKYTPDFVFPNGLIVEAKGHFTSKDRTKMVEVKKENPDLNIRMLFMRDNFITKNKAMTYSQWCVKNGFLCAFMKVPEEWINT